MCIACNQLIRWTLTTGLMYLSVIGWCQPSTIAGWKMEGLSNFGPSPFAPIISAPSVIVHGGLARGPGVGTNGDPDEDAWGGNGFDVDDFDGALTGNKYVTFSVSADPGNQISLVRIEPYNIRRSGPGPKDGQWQYSLDGIEFTNIGDPIFWGNRANPGGNPQPSIDLSDIDDLQNIPHGTTVTFRIYSWGASQETGNWYINSLNTPDEDLVITGTIEAALPVDLLTFEADFRQDQVYLSWSFDNARNFDRFSIEHSTDSKDWSEIGIVAYSNNSDRQARYTHLHPAPGANYYRLRMIDKDGMEQLGPIQSVQVPRSGGFTPINTLIDTELIITRNGSREDAYLTLTDLQGRIMSGTYLSINEETVRMDLGDLVKGVYLLQVVSREERETFKVVKK